MAGTIEPARSRHALAAALTLFGLLGGHTILEVARDALFLGRLPAEQLPATYLAIALVATLAAQLDARVLRGIDDRRVVMLTLLAGAAGAVAFQIAFRSDASWVPHAFYVWTGTIATLAVAQFWRMLSGVFTVADAKKRYAHIGAGGAIGAMAGAGLAEIAQRWLAPQELLGLGAAVFAITALGPGLLPAATDDRRRVRHATRSETPSRTRRYARGLLLLVALTAATATLVDYAFKSTVDREVAPAELGIFFSRFYLGLNLVSLIVQVAVVPRALPSLGVARALLVLPAALGAAGLGAFVVAGIGAAILLRGADGGLRQSLYRSAVEILYLPLSPRARKLYKASVDAIGQRTGQAAGALAILGATFVGLELRALGLVVIACAAASAAVVLWLRAGYVDLLRANLRAGAIETRPEIPTLDLHSLEALVASLGSERDDEVLASLDLLVGYERAHLVPATLLYHPSPAIVLRVLEILDDAGRVDHLPIAHRLLEHADADVRAAAMRAVADGLDAQALRAELTRDRPLALRAALLVALVSRGLDRDGAARRELEDALGVAPLDARLAIARAVRLERDPELRWVLESLAAHTDLELRREVARGLGALGDPAAVGTLVHWLGPRGARAEARSALVAIGPSALEALRSALADVELPRSLRAHLPRTIARFGHASAARVLFDQLEHEPDGWVRYKILRALRALRETLPDLHFDAERLAQGARSALDRAARILGQRIAVRVAHERDPSLLTPGGRLLEPILREKEQQAIERAIRMIALSHPRERLNGIVHALRSDDAHARAETRELLSNIADHGAAGALGALLDDELGDGDRLARALAALGHAPHRGPEYLSLLRELVGDESEAIRCIAAHHAGELGASELEDSLRDAQRRAAGLSADVIARALDAVRAPRVRHA
jgi:hypothetical protein